MKKSLWSLLIFFTAAASTAIAQPIGVGVKLGTTVTDVISAPSVSSYVNTQHFLVGPYVELRLPFNLAVEADALYLHDLYGGIVAGSSGSTWQFPVLAKYRFLSGPLRPYIEGGPSFSHITDIAEIPELNHRSNFGIVVGAGLELKILVLRIAPEIRYTGWTRRDFVSSTGLFQSNRNQATFEVGIGF
ncbi:MAG TPA: outer membrane beta-barrel protein [Bryobacteraceae bacterium]|nr:outer membrane beta-barrel protein [Bryobacteraceae bacterium]